eukprot:271770-Rhodomonas_salina.1
MKPPAMSPSMPRMSCRRSPASVPSTAPTCPHTPSHNLTSLSLRHLPIPYVTSLCQRSRSRRRQRPRTPRHSPPRL